MSESKVQIAIRPTEDERDSIKLMASKENKSMNQYILDKVLSVDDGTNADNDMTIKVLSKQIAVKDEQLNRMQNLLDQQQRITLAEVGEKDRLKLESNEASKKNFIQRLFNL